jgi:hypothetical protein
MLSRMKQAASCIWVCYAEIELLLLFFLVLKLMVLIQAATDPHKFTISFIYGLQDVSLRHPDTVSLMWLYFFLNKTRNGFAWNYLTASYQKRKKKTDQFCYQFNWCRWGCFAAICFLFPFCISNLAFCVCFPSFILPFFCLYIIVEIILICRLDLYSGVVDSLLKYSFRGQSLYRSYLTEGATLLMENRKGNSKAR